MSWCVFLCVYVLRPWACVNVCVNKNNNNNNNKNNNNNIIIIIDDSYEEPVINRIK